MSSTEIGSLVGVLTAVNGFSLNWNLRTPGKRLARNSGKSRNTVHCSTPSGEINAFSSKDCTDAICCNVSSE